MSKEIVHVSGKRKSAIARATMRPGKGIVRVNGILLDVFEPKLARMKIREPLMLADEIASKVDVDIVVCGGGVMSGADAARLAVARALVEFEGKAVLREKFLNYDRSLLVADVRYKETCKPNDSKARAKRQKSYR